jgi:hypothetical protein
MTIFYIGDCTPNAKSGIWGSLTNGFGFDLIAPRTSWPVFAWLLMMEEARVIDLHDSGHAAAECLAGSEWSQRPHVGGRQGTSGRNVRTLNI